MKILTKDPVAAAAAAAVAAVAAVAAAPLCLDLYREVEMEDLVG